MSLTHVPNPVPTLCRALSLPLPPCPSHPDPLTLALALTHPHPYPTSPLPPPLSLTTQELIKSLLRHRFWTCFGCFCAACERAAGHPGARRLPTPAWAELCASLLPRRARAALGDMVVERMLWRDAEAPAPAPAAEGATYGQFLEAMARLAAACVDTPDEDAAASGATQPGGSGSGEGEGEGKGEVGPKGVEGRGPDAFDWLEWLLLKRLPLAAPPVAAAALRERMRSDEEVGQLWRAQERPLTRLFRAMAEKDGTLRLSVLLRRVAWADMLRVHEAAPAVGAPRARDGARARG